MKQYYDSPHLMAPFGSLFPLIWWFPRRNPFICYIPYKPGVFPQAFLYSLPGDHVDHDWQLLRSFHCCSFRQIHMVFPMSIKSAMERIDWQKCKSKESTGKNANQKDRLAKMQIKRIDCIKTRLASRCKSDLLNDGWILSRGVRFTLPWTTHGRQCSRILICIIVIDNCGIPGCRRSADRISTTFTRR